jgi:hypothetical protein
MFPWSQDREDILLDQFIISDRINPQEVRDNASEMTKRVDKYNDEFLNRK